MNGINMGNFELRGACNKLVAELNNSESKKNIIKLSIDIQLPDRFSGKPDGLFQPIQTLSGYLARVLINGLINIEILLHSLENSTVNIHVRLSGQGVIRPVQEELRNIEAYIKNTGLQVIYKQEKEQIFFEFDHSFQTLESKKTEIGLPFSKKNVLIAEDNEINAMVFSSFLDEWGCKNVVAINGADAVAQAHDKIFDAILMDIHMPILNGNQATQKIREFSSVPIIALTASTQESDIKDAMEAGANDYLLKPISSTHLFHVLSKYL